MSEAVAATQQHPEHRLVIQGRILSSQPLVNLRVLDKTSGQAADVEVAITYRFRNLSRNAGEGETAYTLLVCLSDQEAIETSITVPAAAAPSPRHYDVDLDQWPRKVRSLVTKPSEAPKMETQAKPGKTQAQPAKPTKSS